MEGERRKDGVHERHMERKGHDGNGAVRGGWDRLEEGMGRKHKIGQRKRGAFQHDGLDLLMSDVE